jgi:hypothetical protein
MILDPDPRIVDRSWRVAVLAVPNLRFRTPER